MFDHPAVVDNSDLYGELVRFVQVLSGDVADRCLGSDAWEVTSRHLLQCSVISDPPHEERVDQMGSDNDGTVESGRQGVKRSRRLRIPEVLKPSRQEEEEEEEEEAAAAAAAAEAAEAAEEAEGYPPAVWTNSNLNEASKRGHQLAGPVMQYDDET